MGHVALVGAVAGGLWLAPVPVIGVLVALGLALWIRHPVSVALAMLALTSFMGHRALVGLDPPDAGNLEGWLTLLDDPRPAGSHGVRFTARFDSRRMAVSAHGPVAGRLNDLLAGEQVHVTGSIRPIDTDDDWARWRHEVGRINVTAVLDHAPGSPIAALANTIRRTLSGGAEALDRPARAVFLGMVIGDDRAQTPATADDFRAAGLGHLLVVSGQNVAFVLAVVAPLVAGRRPGQRMVVLLAVLALFAVLTRFEPSVLRAVAMAGVGIGAGALGTPVDGRRALSWAIAGLLVVDPFLIHVLAFQLSAAATAGIVWFSKPLAAKLAGPMWFRVSFATTVAAQLAVSPLLVATFGPMPLASLPANLLAGPVSGPVMMWGFTGGLVAGIFGGWPAALIHAPTAVMLWWIRGVAAGAAGGPQATLGAAALTIVMIAAIAVVIGTRPVRVAAAGAAILMCVMSIASTPRPSPGISALGQGVELRRMDGHSVVVLTDPGAPRSVLETLRVAGAGRPDLVVAVDGDAGDGLAVVALSERFENLLIVAPPLHRVPGAKTVRGGDTITLGGVVVTVATVDPRIEVTMSRAPPAFMNAAAG